MNNILISNLDPDATEQDIRAIFDKHGTVERLKIMTDRKTARPRGLAFVEMRDDAEAEMAITAANGTELKGRRLTVSAARPQLHRVGGPNRRSIR